MLRMEEELEEEASQYGSGCESGWTMYLGQSCESSASPLNEGDAQEEEEEVEEEEEEDLSMVSDASSGPPHAHEDDDCCYPHLGEKNGCCFSAPSSSPPAAALLPDKCWKRRRVETEHQNQRQVANALVDDTASSPFLGLPGNVRRLLLHQQNCKPTPFGISNNNNLCSNQTLVEEALEFSYDFSATYLKGKTTLQKPLHYMKPTSAKPVCNGEFGKKIR